MSCFTSDYGEYQLPRMGDKNKQMKTLTYKPE